MTDSTPPPPPLAIPDWFAPRCEELGVALDPGEADQIARYLAILLDTNTRTNLTAIKDPEAAWEKHALDALSLLGVLAEAEPASERLSIADVGTGGGLPGVILAITRPDAEVTLIDATAKKTAFIDTVIATLGLTNARTVNGRAEDLGAFRGRDGRGALRDAFDVVVARAVSRVAVAAELCVPLAREQGLIVLVKGAKAEEELAEAKQALYELHTRTLALFRRRRAGWWSLRRRDEHPRSTPDVRASLRRLRSGCPERPRSDCRGRLLCP